MPLTTLIYLIVSIGAGILSVVWHPEWGVYGYLVSYNITPRRQWWGAYLPDIVNRYALFFSVCTGAGLILRWQKIGARWELLRIEKIYFMYLVFLWVSVVTGLTFLVDENLIKMSKVGIMMFMATRIIQTRKLFERMVLTLMGSALYLSFALHTGAGGYVGSRFDRGFGGSDFAESNFLAAHFAWLLPFVGITFLMGGWKKKLFAIIAAGFMVNSIILTRSRGAFLALLLGGVWTIFCLPRVKRHRKKILIGLVAGLLGAVMLTDAAFWERMETIKADQEERDLSAQSRLAVWQVAVRMSLDYPMGVGIGQFFNYVGHYNPALEGKDTHNTYLRCLTETGFLGLLGLVLLIINSFRTIRELEKDADSLDDAERTVYHLYSLASRIALVNYLAAAFFISSTYVEEFYWLLLLPAFLTRSLRNERSRTVQPTTG